MISKEPEIVSVHIYTDEEIDFFLTGDRRSIDRLMMKGMNSLASVLVDQLKIQREHMNWEEDILNSLGTQSEIEQRIQWIKTQIERQQVRNRMMRKVFESTLIWASIAFVAFATYALWDHIKILLYRDNSKLP